MPASGHTKKRGSVVQVGAGKPTRRSGLHPSVEALHRRVNRAILRDRYGTFHAAGVVPLMPRVIAQGVTYRRPKPPIPAGAAGQDRVQAAPAASTKDAS